MQTIPFDTVTLSASLVNTNIQAYALLPTNFKCYGVVANLFNSPAGTVSINVVFGPAAEGSLGTKDTQAVGGTIMLGTDFALTVTANTPQVIIPDVWDTIYGPTLPLTLRVVTNSSGAGKLKVALFGKFIDANSMKGFLANNSQPTY